MKGFLNTVGGLCIFTEISMFMRATNGLEEFSTVYITSMVLIAALGYFSFKKAYLYGKEPSFIEVKKEAPRTNMTNSVPQKENDYLIKNGFDKNILQHDSIELWQEIAEDAETDNALKEVILTFFVPYKISLLKYGLNTDYFKLPDFMKINGDVSIDGSKKSNFISPSLQAVCKYPEYRVEAYPDFFYIAFPDVMNWLFQTEFLKVREILSHYMGTSLLDDDSMDYIILKQIIDGYLKATNKKLECSIIANHYQFNANTI